MDNNDVLKLNSKKVSNSPKIKNPNPLQVQTELADSMTQRMNVEEQPSQLIPQSPSNSEPNSKSKSKSVKSGIKSIPETPLSQSKINEIIYGKEYGDPAIENQNQSNNLEMMNQDVPVVNMLENVGACSVAVDCPYCNTPIQSKVESNCNCLTIFLYILMIIIFPLMCIASIYRAGTGTHHCCTCYTTEEGGTCDCCNDVTHTCPKCGKVIGESDSCMRLFSCI